MALNLYGVVRAGHPIEKWTTPPLALRLISAGDLAVALREVDPDRVLVDDDAVEYLEVLSSLVLDGAVLPFRLGTIAPDEAAVHAEILTARAAQLRDLLNALDGLVEVRVDVRFDVETALQAAVSSDRALRDLSVLARASGLTFDDRLRLGEQVAAAMAQWLRGRVEELLAPLAALAERSAPIQVSEEGLQRTAFLVRLDRFEEIDRLLGVVRDGAPSGVEISALGPMPAYSFLDDLDLTPQQSAPSRWGW